MRPSRRLIATGYGLALLLLVLPLLEPMVTLLPPRPGQVRWRLQAFGVLSLSLLLPLVGGVVALVTAVLLRQRMVVRVLAGLNLFAGAVLTVASGLFVLDLLEYRNQVGTDLQEYYRVAGVIYLVSLLLGAAFLLFLGVVAWRAAARSWRLFARPPGEAHRA